MLFLFASIETEIVDDPKFLTALSKNLWFLIAAELIKTLSAPFLRLSSISFNVWIPPPTDMGINMLEDDLLIKSKIYFFSYKLATQSW